MPPSTVLVACPTSIEYESYFAQWWAAYQAFTYANKAVFMADTTPGSTAYYDTLVGRGVPCVHVEPRPVPYGYLLSGWKAIAQNASGYTYVCSIEADVVCPPNTLTVLVELADRYNLVWLAHEYPGHVIGERVSALGCTLLRVSAGRAVVAADGWGDVIDSHLGIDAYIYESFRGTGGRCVDLANVLNIMHLG